MIVYEWSRIGLGVIIALAVFGITTVIGLRQNKEEVKDDKNTL